MANIIITLPTEQDAIKLVAEIEEWIEPFLEDFDLTIEVNA